VKIRVQIFEDTDRIVLHTNRQTIRRITLIDNDDVPANTIIASINSEKHFLTISSATNFTQGDEYRIDIAFTGILSEDMHGFYRSSYTTGNEIR
jgi:hypothetical protein